MSDGPLGHVQVRKSKAVDEKAAAKFLEAFLKDQPETEVPAVEEEDEEADDSNVANVALINEDTRFQLQEIIRKLNGEDDDSDDENAEVYRYQG